MAIYLLKRSYQLKDIQEVSFKDLWGDKGIFTTMWIFGKPPKILFFENHIQNFIKSLEVYELKKDFLKNIFLKLLIKIYPKQRVTIIYLGLLQTKKLSQYL